MKSNTTSTNTAWGSAWQPRAPGWAGALCLAAASPSLPRGDRAPCPLSTRGRHLHLLFFLFWFLWEAVLPSSQGVDASISQSWVRVLTHSSSEVRQWALPLDTCLSCDYYPILSLLSFPLLFLVLPSTLWAPTGPRSDNGPGA